MGPVGGVRMDEACRWSEIGVEGIGKSREVLE